jgi:hypothetical protein
VIIKGKSRSSPGALAAHLENAETNERVTLLETRGTVAQDLRGALIEMDAVAAGTNCEKPLYHAAISPEPPNRLTPEQRTEAIDALEKKLGLEGHARAVVMHEKLGREHIHVVWSRIDVGQMRAVHDGHNYRKHEEVARDLERRFGHERVQGAHAERGGPDGLKGPRPDRTPSRAELRQEERTGIKGKDVKAQVTALFKGSDGPEAFQVALAEKGYQLAKGDRRDFVIIDQRGGIHSLARRIEGVKAADLRDFMSPVDLENLPNAIEAKAAAMLRFQKLKEAREDVALERGYGRGDGYVSQAQAAQKDFERRQKELNRSAAGDDAWSRIEAGEAERERRRKEAENTEPARTNEGAAASGTSEDTGNVEITDAVQARLDRLAAAKSETASPRDGPGRQSKAPGGGHTGGW